jgi:molybdopterin synthase catalytic subunit
VAEPIIGLVREPIDVVSLRSRFADPTRGAVVVFEGVVRSSTAGVATAMLVYEAYEEMALPVMAEIAKCNADADVAIVHRLGEVMPGETAVVCIAACAHRDQAFAVCRMLIDCVKVDVPIWKKEG